MYNHFEYTNGSNPYITINNAAFFKMLCKYHYTQIGENSFIVTGLRAWNGKQTREGKKLLLRAIAQDWQADFEKFNYSYEELAGWQDFFEEYGKKYGLLKEFRENAII